MKLPATKMNEDNDKSFIECHILLINYNTITNIILSHMTLNDFYSNEQLKDLLEYWNNLYYELLDYPSFVLYNNKHYNNRLNNILRKQKIKNLIAYLIVFRSRKY